MFSRSTYFGRLGDTGWSCSSQQVNWQGLGSGLKCPEIQWRRMCLHVSPVSPSSNIHGLLHTLLQSLSFFSSYTREVQTGGTAPGGLHSPRPAKLLRCFLYLPRRLSIPKQVKKKPKELVINQDCNVSQSRERLEKQKRIPLQ